ncbi:MAG: diadenylate cyclase CdaA [Bacteroidota bacterium]|nr:diadenylate cyclase CdaA [Rhodothermia bacterium]MDW8284804.1 diadenylate cyclase CdaA [Bacteroidota bacterium]
MRLFQVGFLEVRLVDLLDIGLVSFLFYKLYQFLRGTLAVPILWGLLLLFLATVLTDLVDMPVLRFLFGQLSGMGVLAVIVLFQPEIRRLLLLLGQTPWLQRFGRRERERDLIGELVDAARNLAADRVGALIVLERTVGLQSYIETGEPIGARVSSRLLQAIFTPRSPLHDGAVIIRNRRIAAAKCILPISQNLQLGASLGMRHRAAVGITEVSDAFVIVVSEETGKISVAERGALQSGLSPLALRERLLEALRPTLQPEESLTFSRR